MREGIELALGTALGCEPGKEVQSGGESDFGGEGVFSEEVCESCFLQEVVLFCPFHPVHGFDISWRWLGFPV